ncbi:MFS transporter [Vacuolonema iberomarrocanum]|uniref:MFS transporter n=1 Tax=Vacuolonema iberomarrocanum TaxID=3454632 RepID=UPI0019EA30C9|nr:MFS transporter [filamentous cyanobacterium LEGE 07170]
MTDSTTPQGIVEHPSEKLNFITKLAYGAGDLGPAITANILGVFLLIFFTNVAGLSPGIAGSLLMLGKIWDAFNDPMVGWVSDRTKSKLGRRLPWMLWGAVPFGLFFCLQWVVPQFSTEPSVNQWSLVAYYLAIAVIFNTFYTIVNLPYTALTAEITHDYDERTSLNSFRFAFSIGGSILSLIIALAIFQFGPTEARSQYFLLGLLCAILSVVPLFLCVWGTKRRVIEMERDRLAKPQAPPLRFREQIRIAFRNRAFLYVIGIYLCSWLAVQNTVTIIPYFVQDWMGGSQQDFTLVVIAVQVTGLAMLFVWSAVSRRIGKRVVYFIGTGIWIVAQIGLFLLQPGQVGMMYGLAVMAGLGVSTAYLIPWSMLPDVIELDEWETGQRREGVFYSFMVLLQKLALAMGLFLVGQVLEVSGFLTTTAGQVAPEQPASALLAIRLLVGPVPAFVLAIGLALAYFYPITREVHAELVLRLEERRSQAIQDLEPPLE